MATAPVGPFVKLVRAHHQLRRMEKLFDSWKGKNPYRIRVDHDTEHRVYVYRLKRVIPPHSSIELLAEEAIYHMRSSLDHLVCALVSGSTRGRGFPIFTEDPDAGDAKPRTRQAWRNLTDGVPEDGLRVIKGFQPYRDGPLASEHPLSRLNQLSIAYKHVSVEQVSVRIIGPRVPDIRLMEGRLEDGAVFALVPDRYDRADIDPHFQIFPSFEVSADGKLLMSLDRLREIHTYLCNEVLPAFAELFD